MLKKLSLLVLATSLTACNGFFDKDNTPQPTALQPYKAEVSPKRIWSNSVGSGAADEYLKLNPAVGTNAIFTAAAKGVVTATGKADGRTLWKIDLDVPLTAGPGVGNGIVIVASRHGDVVALNEVDGKVRWKQPVHGEVLANPVVENNVVVIKSINGSLHALSARDGHKLWTDHQAEPSLVLHASSSPVVEDNDLIVGFANGSLTKMGLNDSRLIWKRSIAIPEGAFAIERMIDIDANPVVYDHRIFAATYQGKIASLDWDSGRTLWSHDISSYTGMSAGRDNVYITDAKSYVWSFNANSGLVNWRQGNLLARVLSGPAVMGDYVVVGDAEGYLHWLSKRDGHVAGRESLGSAIFAAPVVERNQVYVLTSSGSLVAYQLG